MKFYIINFWHDRSYKNRVGGPIKVLELAENLRAMGHSATLFVPKLGYPEKQTDTQLEQIHVADISVVRPLLYSFMNMLRLIKCCIRSRPDIIYIRYMYDFIPSLFARLVRIPCIIEINDVFPASFSIKDRFLSLLNRINFGSSNRIIVLTEGTRDKLISRLGVRAEKIHVSSSGTNTDIFYPRDKESCRKSINLDMTAKVIGFAGSFVSNYGLDTLILASPEIIKVESSARFLIVGDGEAEDKWKGMVERLKMGDYFIFPGQVSRTRAAELIGAMDICVAPYNSSRDETSPVKLYDYFACARPVVASAIEALKSVRDELPGLVLVEPDNPDALTEGLIGVFDHYEHYEEEARKTKNIIFEKYSWRRVTEDVVDVALSIQ